MTLFDKVDEDELELPPGRTDPRVRLDEAVFSLVVARDGWMNAVLETDDRTIISLIAVKLREIAAQLERVGATKH